MQSLEPGGWRLMVNDYDYRCIVNEEIDRNVMDYHTYHVGGTVRSFSTVLKRG